MRDKVIESSFMDFSSLVFANITSLFLQIGAVVLTTRMLGSEGYGKFSLFLLVAELVFLFGISWTSASVIRYGREEFVKTGKINKTFWSRNIILIPILIVFFILLSLFKRQILGYVCLKNIAFPLLILYILGKMSLNYTQYIQQAIGQLKLFAATNIIQKLLIIIGLFYIFIVSSISKNVTAVIVVNIIALFGTTLIFINFLKREYFIPVKTDLAYIKRIFLFSYPIILGSGSAYIVNYIDLIVIKKYMEVAEVGIYSLSYRGFIALQSISMSLIAVLAPMIVTFLTEKREDLIKKFVKRIIIQGVLFWSIFLSVIVFLASVFIPIIFGENFQESIWPFSILMIGLAFNCIGSFYSPILTAYELIKQAMAVNITMALINLVGDFILVPHIGILGAATASSLSFAFSAVLYLIIANKRLNLREWHQILGVSPLIALLFICLFSNKIWFQGVGLCLVIVATIAMVRKSNMFSKDDIQMFIRIRMPPFVRKILVSTYNFLAIK